MAIMGKAIGRDSEATQYSHLEETARNAFQLALFDTGTGRFRDGVGTDHQSLHANLFPLAFDLVPTSHRESVATWLIGRGMRCSVYAAQYLLEGLFESGQSKAAIDLILAPGDRSWRHMVESGTTITWEAWDQKYKPNQDWNHAWGAAPANLLPKYVLGVQALTPGWKSVLVKPHVGSLKFASGKIPTPMGPVLVDWRHTNNFTLSLKLPKTMSAQIEMPALAGSTQVLIDGKTVTATRRGDRWILPMKVTGTTKVEVK